ncbi:MAG: hypothetical protein JNK57_07830 [Planctomycetaceae bacterium]|nr:hypothetical protein [Planctomycetaceae bacterium]
METNLGPVLRLVGLVLAGCGLAVGSVSFGHADEDARVPEMPTVRTFLDDYQNIRDFLLAAEPESRAYYRFLTLSPMASPSFHFSEQSFYHIAVAKLLNSLSWETKLICPEIVPGSAGFVLAIDLRELRWTAGNQWLEILSQYPYGLKFEHASDQTLRQAAADVQELSQAEMPLLRADWFIYALSQPPLYPQLLQLPLELTDLEQRLGIQIEENITRGEIARAGFSQSSMSPQNRLIERHEGKYGAVWIGYEFLPRRGKGDLVRFPLGPRSDNNPFNRHAFQADGQSILFQLPNGLFGYYLVDQHGRRVDHVSNTNLAYDRTAISGTPTMVTGLSCLHCHHQGLQTGFRDEVRAAGVLVGDGLDRLQQVYWPAENMQKLAERDQQPFLAADRQIVARYSQPSVNLVAAGQPTDAVTYLPEPIGFCVTRYLRDLGPAEIAAELGLSDIESIRSQIQLKPSLRHLGLGTLLQEQAGKIKRHRWEAIDGTSLFQDVAVELGLGTPIQSGSTHKSRSIRP